MNTVSNYNKYQKILLVGEGDFSFSLSLPKSFGSAINMIATSLDTREEVESKFSKGKANLEELERLGCRLVHGVNVHSIKADLGVLGWILYDRIIFNFPHSGSAFGVVEHLKGAITKHQEVVRGFMKNASKMIKDESGEIHVTHKTTYPFYDWDIDTLAQKEGLDLDTLLDFKTSNFPGYCNKKGGGNIMAAGMIVSLLEIHLLMCLSRFSIIVSPRTEEVK